MMRMRLRNSVKAAVLAASLIGSTLFAALPVQAATTVTEKTGGNYVIEIPITQTFSVYGDKNADAPSVAYNISVTDGNKNVEVSPNSFSLSGTTPEADVTFKFAQAGVYTATVEPALTEAQKALPDAWTFDESRYYIRAYVKNTGSVVVTAERLAPGEEPTGDDTKKVAAVEFNNMYSTCKEDPPIEKRVEGTNNTSEQFNFTMTADDPSYPMPAGSSNGAKRVTVGPGSYEFGWIYFDRKGTFTYTVTEEAGENPNYTYDPTVYTKTIIVDKIDGKLVITKSDYTSSNGVTDTALFINKYTEPSTGGGNGPGSGGRNSGGRKPRATTPTTPGEVLGATRDAAEDAGRGVLGAVRNPQGQVLGAVRTGDSSAMVTWAVILMLAASGIVGWFNMYQRRKRNI